MGLQPAPLPKHHLRAELLLLTMTVLWGSTFAATRWALADMATWQLLAIRFTFATVLAVVWRPASLRVRGHGPQWSAALWLALWLGVGFWTQAEGMQTTTASRSSFITALSVVLVPVFQIVVLRRVPRRGALVGIAIAMGGLWLLCRPAGGALVVGDVWTLGCAVAFAVYIVELSRLSPRVDLGRLVVAQCALVAVVSWAMGMTAGAPRWDLSVGHWAVLIHLGVLCTFVTTVVLSRFQRDTTPTRAALIYSAEPVFAALIAWAALSEALTRVEIAGAALILAGIVISELR